MFIGEKIFKKISKALPSWVFGVRCSPLDMLEIMQFASGFFLVSLQLGSIRPNHEAMLARLDTRWNQGWKGIESSKWQRKFVVWVFEQSTKYRLIFQLKSQIIKKMLHGLLRGVTDPLDTLRCAQILYYNINIIISYSTIICPLNSK